MSYECLILVLYNVRHVVLTFVFSFHMLHISHKFLDICGHSTVEFLFLDFCDSCCLD